MHRERILEYRDESQRLDQCSRLYDSSVSNYGFEQDASHIVQVRFLKGRITFHFVYFVHLFSGLELVSHDLPFYATFVLVNGAKFVPTLSAFWWLRARVL